jgi:hypothetical protein
LVAFCGLGTAARQQSAFAEGLQIEVACRPPRRSYNASRRFKEPTDEVLQRLDWSRVQVRNTQHTRHTTRHDTHTTQNSLESAGP